MCPLGGSSRPVGRVLVKMGWGWDPLPNSEPESASELFGCGYSGKSPGDCRMAGCPLGSWAGCRGGCGLTFGQGWPRALPAGWRPVSVSWADRCWLHSEHPRGPSRGLGLLGEVAQLGQRHLLPQPCDLPKHGLRWKTKEWRESGCPGNAGEESSQLQTHIYGASLGHKQSALEPGGGSWASQP